MLGAGWFAGVGNQVVLEEGLVVEGGGRVCMVEARDRTVVESAIGSTSREEGRREYGCRLKVAAMQPVAMQTAAEESLGLRLRE